METLTGTSIKIKKRTRNTSKADQNYICGGCRKSYKSYPALYLHIKRKHDGVRPAETRTSKPLNSQLKNKIQTGRPTKPFHNIDNVNDEEIYIEELQNDLLGFLGDKIGSLSMFESKPKLEEIVKIVQDVKNKKSEQWLDEIKRESKVIFEEIIARNEKDIDIHIDYEEIKSVSLDQPLRAIVWFIFWFARYSIKANFIPDLCVIFGKIFKVLSELQLDIADLDNKLIWTNVMKECDGEMTQFVYFNNSKEVIFEFIKKVCHLLGKTFE